jgi:hypothetical protein
MILSQEILRGRESYPPKSNPCLVMLHSQGPRSRLGVMIQEPPPDDVILTPLKVDGTALPRAQEWNAASLKAREGVDCSGGWHALTDDDGTWPGSLVEHRRVRGLAAMMGGAECIRRTNGYEWPSEEDCLPHLVLLRGNRANREMDHADGQVESAFVAILRFATHPTAHASKPNRQQTRWPAHDSGYQYQSDPTAPM